MKFTPEIRTALLERFAAGLTIEDACRGVIRAPTFKTWMTRGRKGDPKYADFARSIDEARKRAAERPEPMDEDELRRVVSDTARKGSVAAQRLLWEMICADRSATEAEDAEPDRPPLASLDELAERRVARA